MLLTPRECTPYYKTTFPMKHFLKAITIILIISPIHAQKTETIIEGLKNQLNGNLLPKKRASIYSDLTWYYSTISTDSAIYYGEKAETAAINLSDSTLLSQVYSDIGAVYFRKGDFEKSKQSYLKSHSIRKARNDEKGLAKINNNLANIYEKTQQYQLAMSAYLSALNYFETTNDSNTIHIIKGNVGLVLFKIKNYSKAFKYIQDVVNYQSRNNLSEGLCVSCLNLGNVYLELTDTLNALKMYEKSVKACKLINNKKGLSSGYNNIATIKTAQKKKKEAGSLYNESEKIRNELNTDLDESNFDFNRASVLFENKNYKEAKNLFLATERIFTKNSSLHKLQLCYNFLIQIYAVNHSIDSVSYYTNKLIGLNNTLLQSSVNEKTAELDTKYETLKKEKLLLEQKNETDRQKKLVVRISLLAVLLVFIAFVIYRQQKLKNRQLAQEFELKLALSEVEKQNRLQEQRLTISRDLHDNIGSQLTFIISSIDSVKYAFKLDDKKLNDKLESISNFTKWTIQELRDTIWAMNSNQINFEDLELQVLSFINKAKDTTTGIEFVFQVNENAKEITFNSLQGMNIFRTIQEAINNSLKYAKPSQIKIEMRVQDSTIQISINDNGQGFDQATVKKGNGLNNMYKRIDEIGGKCNIESSAKGTTITITMLNT